jgi:RimJ/RimL family protein N-acetyltransferase
LKSIIIRELQLSDEAAFLSAMQRSKSLYDTWMSAPLTHDQFIEFFNRYNQINHKSFLLCNTDNDIMGVFNLSEIVRSVFQNAYLGFSAVIDYAGKGYMSVGLKILLKKVFTEMELHRLEANIQPGNINSINLVKANGFRKEGYSPHYLKINSEWRDFERWAITSEDWDVIKKDV